jgi:hypothetical protein
MATGNSHDEPSHGHSHGHSHGSVPLGPVGIRVRRLLAAIVIPLVVGTLIGLAVLWPSSPKANPLAGPTATGLIAADVVKVTVDVCTAPGAADAGVSVCDFVTIELPGGDEAMFEQSQLADIALRRGDSIYVDRYERST